MKSYSNNIIDTSLVDEKISNLRDEQTTKLTLIWVFLLLQTAFDLYLVVKSF